MTRFQVFDLAIEATIMFKIPVKKKDKSWLEWSKFYIQ